MSATTQTRQARIKQNSAERRERSRQETRQAILEAAIEMFEREGYEGFSLRQVAESIGYTPTTIYLYFKDKDDLLFAVCSQGFLEFTQALRATYQAHPDPRARLRALGQTYFEFGMSHPLHYRMMFMQRSEWITRASAQARAGGEAAKGLNAFEVQMSAVVEAMRAGAVRLGDPLATTNLVWAAVHGVVSLALSMRDEVPGWREADARRLLEEHLDVLMRGLEP